MEVLDAAFTKRFIQLCLDGYKKGWHERNGGNLSYRLIEEEVSEIKESLDLSTPYHPIGTTVSSLGNEYFMVKCTGAYMMNMGMDPLHSMGIIHLNEKGDQYQIVFGMKDGNRPTSELPSHLSCLEVIKKRSGGKLRVVYHCHATNLIALSFVLPLDSKVWSHNLWEMATECPIVFPAGVGVVPWMVPGGKAIADATAKLVSTYDVAIWAHHGVFTVGDSFDSTWGLVDTVEKSAEILTKVISMGGKRQTITDDDFRLIEKDFKVEINKNFLD